MAQTIATEAELEALYPEFTAVDSGLISVWLAVTEEMIDPNCFETLQSQAQCMLTAHFIAGIPGSGVGANPAVTSKSIDKISASYAVPTMLPADADLGSTKYGQHFIALRNSLPCVAIVAGPRNL